MMMMVVSLLLLLLLLLVDVTQLREAGPAVDAAGQVGQRSRAPVKSTAAAASQTVGRR